eukprot:746640-Hanusia_phi.AAC.2
MDAKINVTPRFPARLAQAAVPYSGSAPDRIIRGGPVRLGRSLLRGRTAAALDGRGLEWYGRAAFADG